MVERNVSRMKTKEITITVGMNVLFLLATTFNQQLMSHSSLSKEITQEFEAEGNVIAVNGNLITVQTSYICFFGCESITEEKIIAKEKVIRIIT